MKIEKYKNIKNVNIAMSNPKVILLFVILLLSCVVMAAEIPGETMAGDDVLMYQTCNNCTFCNITDVRSNNGTLLLSNIEFDANGTYYSYLLDGGNTTSIGTYTYCYYCGNTEESQTGCINFNVTTIGQGNINVGANIILLIFFCSLFSGVFYVKRKIDFKRLYDTMLDKYYSKNFVKVALMGLGYTLMDHTIIMYYLIGFLVMLTLSNIILTYSVIALMPVMEGLMYVYAWASILVGLNFLGYIQEFVMNAIDDIQNMEWGFERHGR